MNAREIRGISHFCSPIWTLLSGTADRDHEKKNKKSKKRKKKCFRLVWTEPSVKDWRAMGTAYTNVTAEICFGECA